MRTVHRMTTQLLPPFIYDGLIVEGGFDPEATWDPKVVIPKRARHRAGRYTARLWDSLRADGTLPDDAPSWNAHTTGEKPTIGENASVQNQA